MSSPYGKWRTGSKPKDNDHHGGQDYARGLGKVGDAHKYHMYAQTDSTITQETFMSVVFQRRGIPDRIAHLHLNHDSREGAVGRVLQGTKLANPLQYGTAFKLVGEVIGRLSGRGDSEHSYATHEHIEYHVLARDPRVGVRILSKNGQAIKGNTTHFRSRNLLSKGMTLRQISPTPYLAHDTPLQGGIAGFASAYVGNTAFTYYNALYRTQLPSGLFAPTTIGAPSKQGSFVAGKGLPVTLFNGSAYAGMDISLNALGDINSAILGDTVAFESAGFELGGGTYVTQRMLASHFADDNGESWTSVFGNADSATVSEMSEQELVAYIANKRYANDEWRSGLVKLSTKGLLTEYLNAKAETNYLLEKIAEQEMKLMAQEALLARVRMNHKDKELESLTEAINVGVAPDFIKAELEKKGDEWIESEVQTGGNEQNDYELSSPTIYNNSPTPKGFTQEKAKVIKRVAEAIGVNPNDLAAVISFETVGTFSPSIKNPLSSATGLIQFMKDGRGRYYGMTREQFSSLSFEQQMVYVEKYFRDRGFSSNKKRDVADTYTAVTGYGYRCGSKAYNLNKVWDSNKDCYIAKGEMVLNKSFKAHQKKYFD